MSFRAVFDDVNELIEELFASKKEVIPCTKGESISECKCKGCSADELECGEPCSTCKEYCTCSR